MSAAGVVLSAIGEDSFLSPDYFLRHPTPNCSKESIMIYLTVAGSVIPMRVMESDSIASVKLRIQTCKGFKVKKQKLVFGGRELARNHCLVKDYGVADGNVLHLVLRLSDLLVISVKSSCGKGFEFHADRNRNVGYIKQLIAKKDRGFVDLKHQALIWNGEKLDDQRLINDICKDNDAVIHLLVQKPAKIQATPVEKNFEVSIVASDLNTERFQQKEGATGGSRGLRIVERKPSDHDFWLEPVVNPKVELPDLILDMIDDTIAGLGNGKPPISSSEGTGGAYFMQDSSGQNYKAVFKPIDEEPMAVNNPRGLPLTRDGEGLKKGTRVGEGALREVAAYILDHPRTGTRSFSGDAIGFSGVRPTVMIRCSHRAFNHPEGYKCHLENVKIGSLQLFVKNHGSCEDMGPQFFPMEEVHKISVLDIRLANADRHAGNILFREEEDGRIVLVPIDHGYCLPETFEDCTFDWLYWPQARQAYSPKTIEYIRSLDAEQDIALLKFHGWELSHECSRILRISTMLLKKGAERGLTPFAIGSIMCRETLKKASVIEEIIREAEHAVLPGMSEAAFLASVSQIMDRRLDELSG